MATSDRNFVHSIVSTLHSIENSLGGGFIGDQAADQFALQGSANRFDFLHSARHADDQALGRLFKCDAGNAAVGCTVE